MTEVLSNRVEFDSGLNCHFEETDAVHACGRRGLLVNHYGFLGTSYSWVACEEHRRFAEHRYPDTVDYCLPLVHPRENEVLDDMIARFCEWLCAFVTEMERFDDAPVD